MKKSFLSRFFIFAVIFALIGSFNAYAQEASSLGNNPKTYFNSRGLDCTGPGEIIYDDGTLENGYGWNTVVTDGRFVSLFTPLTYPWQFNTFCLALTRVAASPTSFTFDIVVYDGTGGGVPGAEIATVPGVTATNIPVFPAFEWYSFDISSVPALSSGSYYIGIKYDPSVHSAPLYSGADESATTILHPGYAYEGTAWSPIETFFGGYRAMAYRTLGPVSGPGQATNPSPVSGAADVDINSDISWTNPAGATSIEVFWGTSPGSLASVYSGAPVTTWDPGTMAYSTTYYWRVNETDGSGTTPGSLWSFTTEADPNIVVIFNEPFADLTCWTPIGPLGTTNWSVNSSNFAGGSAPELQLIWTPEFDGLSQLLSCTINSTAGQEYNIILNHMCDWYADPAPFMGLAVTYDGGTTNTSLWQFQPVAGNVGPEVVTTSFTPTSNSFQLILYLSGNSFNIDFWYVDDLLIQYIVPVELTSFAASVVDGKVNLNWQTATETNNYGFEVERKATGQEFTKVGFVGGYGTTTEVKNYSFVDNSVISGSYTYRLKQVDLDGTFEYSSEVEVDLAPASYSLAQNYPNPFNPSTKIDFSLASDSKVTLKIFDVLGQEVITLINGNLSAGVHSQNFDAVSLNSGVYFYTIEAVGVDPANGTGGTNFSSTKKMILTK